MVQVGDVVKINGRFGQWVVLNRHVHGVPPGRLWRVRRQEGDLLPDFVVSDGDIAAVLDHPVFTPNQVVRFDHSFDRKAACA